MGLDGAARNRQLIQDIKKRYLLGEISRDLAITEAAPVIQAINQRGAEVAKKWGKRYAPQTFIGLMR